MTPNTDALLSLQRRESVPNNARGIQRFLFTHNGNTHHTQSCFYPPWRDTYFVSHYFSVSLSFLSPAVYCSSSLTSSPFHSMYLVTGLFFSAFHCHLSLGLSLHCCTGTFSRNLHCDLTSFSILVGKSFAVFLLFFSLSPVFCPFVPVQSSLKS